MSKKLEDMKKLTDLTNEFIERFIQTLDPREYDGDRKYFINKCLTAPSAIAAEIIDKIAGTFHIERQFILKQYIDKTKLALKWVDHKQKGK
ncbi:hypothetical protein UFOVP100_17 [uncultured Caudovirales phage]|uniref:Uncharacterized protein n=1 Tax=uncultured Caudovirales phage TaxID=2100421 RepID=A0A6J5L0D5_9CAUD|nr:hypothetical protein UFOVP100_17 [uncultured Caudovirales phage]